MWADCPGSCIGYTNYIPGPVTNCLYAGVFTGGSASASPSKVCVGQVVTFSASASQSGGSNRVITTDSNCNKTTNDYYVSGPVQISPSSPATTTYSSAGTHQFTFTATAKNGVCSQISTSLVATVEVVDTAWGPWQPASNPSFSNVTATAGPAVCVGEASTASCAYTPVCGAQTRIDTNGCTSEVQSQQWCCSSVVSYWFAWDWAHHTVAGGNGTSASFVAPGPGLYTVYFTLNCYSPVYAAAGASTTVLVSAPSGNIKEISFTGDHPMYQNSTDNGGWGVGPAINAPQWTSSGTNWPVCYTKGSTISMTVKLDVNGNLPDGQSKTVTFLADGPDNLDATTTFDVTGSNTVEKTVTLTTSASLSNLVYKATPTFTWKLICGGGTNSVGSSSHTVYVTYAAPIVTVEGQDNKTTAQRLEFCIVGVAEGQSDKVSICDKIVEKVRNMTGDSYGSMPENPRWLAYERPPPRDLDCHHRAALAASAFGMVGVQGYVHKVFATSYPVPAAPPGYPANSTKNDYVSTYTDDRIKYRMPGADVHQLVFVGNYFEGCVRVEDGSADDGNAWWTVWPRQKHDTAKALLIWYDASYREQWVKQDWTVIENETVPVGQLADKPKILGGPE